MESSDLPQDILQSAYRIFVDEIEKHLNETKVYFCDHDLTDIIELKDAKLRFHLIKGGAGFFGLEEIEKTASSIESILKELTSKGSGEVDTLRKQYHSLVELVAKIPKPQDSSTPPR